MKNKKNLKTNNNEVIKNNEEYKKRFILLAFLIIVLILGLITNGYLSKKINQINNIFISSNSGDFLVKPQKIDANKNKLYLKDIVKVYIDGEWTKGIINNDTEVEVYDKKQKRYYKIPLYSIDKDNIVREKNIFK